MKGIKLPRHSPSVFAFSSALLFRVNPTMGLFAEDELLSSTPASTVEDVPLHELPLAARMRPRTFDEFVGQQHLVGPSAPLRRAIEADRPPSCIFFGPAGTGKTTLARLCASLTCAHFEDFSAVTGGVAARRP